LNNTLHIKMEDLPREMICEIIHFAPPGTGMILSLVSKQLRELVQKCRIVRELDFVLAFGRDTRIMFLKETQCGWKPNICLPNVRSFNIFSIVCLFELISGLSVRGDIHCEMTFIPHEGIGYCAIARVKMVLSSAENQSDYRVNAISANDYNILSDLPNLQETGCVFDMIALAYSGIPMFPDIRMFFLRD
jgi:hypothetical protein